MYENLLIYNEEDQNCVVCHFLISPPFVLLKKNNLSKNDKAKHRGFLTKNLC